MQPTEFSGAEELICQYPAEAWLVGKEDEMVRPTPGETIALPANQLHIFRAVGDATLRLLGTDLSAQLIVNYDDGTQSVMGTTAK